MRKLTFCVLSSEDIILVITDAKMDRTIHSSYMLELDSKSTMGEAMAAKKMRYFDEF